MLCYRRPIAINCFIAADDGNSHYVTNRLECCADIGKQTDKNIAKQDMDENGCLTECFGHEIWAPDGKGLYFVKYSDSRKNRPVYVMFHWMIRMLRFCIQSTGIGMFRFRTTEDFYSRIRSRIILYNECCCW